MLACSMLRTQTFLLVSRSSRNLTALLHRNLFRTLIGSKKTTDPFYAE